MGITLCIMRFMANFAHYSLTLRYDQKLLELSRGIN